jgi:hypothetical protein
MGMIRRRNGQRSLWDAVLFGAPDPRKLTDPKLRVVDELLNDEALVDGVLEAMRGRFAQSGRRSRYGTPAEVALRMLVLKHLKSWSYEQLEWEVTGNLVYRHFCRIDGGKVPDAKTMVRLGQLLEGDALRGLFDRVVQLAAKRRVTRGRKMRASGAQGPATIGDGGATIGVAIQISCVSPCHGFNGVVSQFQASVHYTEYLANISSATPETEWTTPGAPCGNCHAIDALQEHAAGHVLTTDGGGVANLASGELQYRDPATGALSSANYAGSATVAEVYCTTCHAVTDANDPHKTGLPWTPGSFPLQFPDDGGTVFIEKSPSTSAVTGTNAGNFGPGDTVHDVPPVARRRHELHHADGKRDHLRALGTPRGSASRSLHGRGRLPLQEPDLRPVDARAEALVRRLPHGRRRRQRERPRSLVQPEPLGVQVMPRDRDDLRRERI